MEPFWNLLHVWIRTVWRSRPTQLTAHSAGNVERLFETLNFDHSMLYGASWKRTWRLQQKSRDGRGCPYSSYPPVAPHKPIRGFDMLLVMDDQAAPWTCFRYALFLMINDLILCFFSFYSQRHSLVWSIWIYSLWYSLWRFAQRVWYPIGPAKALSYFPCICVDHGMYLGCVASKLAALMITPWKGLKAARSVKTGRLEK